jgi:gamma-glutamylcyclotransferase (GGCT)/AIG2-like uncharacterized protein YtfP
MHVFTYGTLMFPEVWHEVVGRQFETVEGTAKGFAIFRVAEGVFPGMVAGVERDLVRGVVYLDVDHASLMRLDLFEGDFYERQAMWVECADGQRRSAEAYVVPPQYRHVLTDEPWRRESFIASGGLEQFKRGFQGYQRMERAGQ